MGHQNNMRQKIQARKTVVTSTNSTDDEENEESGEPDLHQCGHCKQMFYNFTKYITHKLQKVCWNAETSPTGEVAPWSMERNGSTSPEDEQTKDKAEDEPPQQQGNVEVKNLHPELQKRKQRKGIVRRIKPQETDIENAESDAVVYVPVDEETIYVQTENECLSSIPDNDCDDNKELIRKDIPVVEDTIYPQNENVCLSGAQESNDNNKELKKKKLPVVEETIYVQTENACFASNEETNSIDNKKQTQIDIASNDFLTTKTSSTGKYGVSLYNSKTKKTGQIHSSRQARSSPQPPLLHQSPVHHKKFYTQSPTKQFTHKELYQHPGFYPQKVSHYSDESDSYSSYKKAKYSYATSEHHRTSNTVVAYSRSQDRYNKETYLRYDQYQTMANFPSEARQSRPNDMSPKDVKDNKKDTEKSKTNEDNSSLAGTNDQPLLCEINPPELVRVSPSTDTHRELTSTLDKSPPALEKCESSNAEGDLLKVEEDESQDSIIEPSEEHKNPGDNPEDTVQSPTAVKFMNMPSPDKGSNSPQGSLNSHETEEFNQDPSGKDASSEIRLPRHRQLSESTVERLITEPSSQTDSSWKHAKQAYRCPLCAKVFPFKSKLQRHVLVHTGIKPYKCTVCGRGFTQQIDLQRHLTRHTGEKPFKCHLCKAQFIRADNLRKHCKDAHYVNIEEPIRKRRRKTTGSDTVLPPLEVAIALALSETERNGGRVLGRATTRSSTKSTTTTTTKQQQSRFPPESPFPPPSRSEESSTTTYSTRMPSHADAHPPYPSSYPPQLGPRVRYPFQHPLESYVIGRRPRSPDYHPNSPPYHRDGRYALSGEPVRYYQGPGGPSPRGYYIRPGYEREGEAYYIEKEEHGVGSGPSSGHGFQVQEYRSMALEQSSHTFVAKRHSRGSEDVKYLDGRGARKHHPEDEHPSEMIADDPHFSGRNSKVDARYGSHAASSTTHSPPEFIQPRLDGEDDSAGGYYGPPRSEDDHRSLFRGKQSISYGDYGPSMSRASDEYERGGSTRPSEKQSVSTDPGEFVTMANDREQNLLQPRPLSASPPSVIDAQGNVYVDEQETPIVRPSDDPSLADNES